MTAEAIKEEKHRLAVLLGELEASLRRESFWLVRGEMHFVLEALPAKNDLIAALLACHNRLRDASQEPKELAPRLARLPKWMEENNRHFGERKEELATALSAVGEAVQRLRRWGKPTPSSERRMAALWA